MKKNSYNNILQILHCLDKTLSNKTKSLIVFLSKKKKEKDQYKKKMCKFKNNQQNSVSTVKSKSEEEQCF